MRALCHLLDDFEPRVADLGQLGGHVVVGQPHSLGHPGGSTAVRQHKHRLQAWSSAWVQTVSAGGENVLVVEEPGVCVFPHHDDLHTQLSGGLLHLVQEEAGGDDELGLAVDQLAADLSCQSNISQIFSELS